ncbi:MAG: hypothetical protein AAEJ53_01210 [Myxococcota bacterium]
MSPRSTRRMLWLLMLLALPLPLLIPGGGLIPAARMLLLGGLCVGMVIAESGSEIAAILAAAFLLHVILYAALLWCAAALIARFLAGSSPHTRTAVVVTCAALLLASAMLTQLYETPYARSPRGNLLEVFR